MSYPRKNIKNVMDSIAAVIVVAAIAVWQFYQFVTFGGAHGGTSHLWSATGLAVVACSASFLVFSGFLRHDTDDDLHITSTARATRI